MMGKAWRRILLIAVNTGVLMFTSVYPVYADPVSLDPNYSASLLTSGLSGPANGITFRSGTNDLLVTEFSANKVTKINLATGVKSLFVNTQCPDEMAMNSKGDILVKNHCAGVVSRFDSNGNFLGSFTPFHGFPSGVAFDNADNLYIADNTTGTIWKFAAGTFTSPTAFASGFPSLEGIAFSPSGQLFAVDHLNGRAYQVTPGGTTLASHILWASGLSTPLNFAFDPISGDIFTSNSNTIVRMSAPGVITIFASGFTPGFGSGTYDLDFDAMGNLYVDDFSKGEIWKFTRTNAPTLTPTPAKTPLILIPGIGGSELKTTELVNWSEPNGHGGTFAHAYPSSETVWVNTLEAAKPGDDDYFDVLRLQTDGQTSQANLALTGNLFAGAYKGTIDFFTSNSYTLEKDLFVFPYDWRKDISTTKAELDNAISQIKNQTGSQKVDIVAHSMGGLVARNYIADIEKAQNVKKLFTLGTPHLGAVKLLKALQYGDSFGPSFLGGLISLNPSEIKDVVQNFVGGFELMPTKKYFDFYSGEDNNHPYPFADVRDIDGNGATGALNYSQIKTLLTNLGHNTNLFGPTETFHNMDNNLANTNGVEVTNIVGSGMPTLGQIIEKYSINFLGIKIPKRDEISINGDKTVPLFSASLFDSGKNMSLLGSAKVFYTKQEHGNLVSSGPALNLVKNILNSSSQLPNDVSNQPYRFRGTGVSVHSPVNIHVHDAFGNHTGPTPDGDFEANIPGSSYDTIDDAKFIWLPDDGVYSIELVATGEGSFDFKIRKFEEDINSQTILYKDVPLTNSTKASAIFDTQSSQPPILNLDENGDGVIDSNIDHFSILEGDQNYDHTPPTISFDVNPKTIWPPNDKMVDITITGSITDENPYVTTILVDDEYDQVEPSITTFETEINQTIQLEPSRRGDDKDGRMYTIKVLVTDLAGNTSLSTFEVLVPHDQRDKR